MATLETAIQIAARAHTGQISKNNRPYIEHPLRVMLRLQSTEAQIVGVLHDVVEDTSVTFDNLRDAGFSESILDALRLVTHDKSEPYAEYVIRLKPNSLAREVKLADLRENADLPRALLRCDRFEKDAQRLLRYVLSFKFLTDEISEEQYRTHCQS